MQEWFLAKKYVAQQNYCSRVCFLISTWFDLREQAPGANLLHESVSGANSLACTEICQPWHDVSPVGRSNWLIFLVPIPQSGCLIIQLPRRVLRVYWLRHLSRSVCLDRVSGASSLVCTGLNVFTSLLAPSSVHMRIHLGGYNFGSLTHTLVFGSEFVEKKEQRAIFHILVL